jgi:hypothetical protein
LRELAWSKRRIWKCFAPVLMHHTSNQFWTNKNTGRHVSMNCKSLWSHEKTAWIAHVEKCAH